MVTQVPISLEAKRAELEAVLASELFMRAPTLAHLLSYLCEKTYAGEGDQIKEYSIGLDVFRRGPEFEQESDSIVRVQANRLRKRLAEYYATEGASHLIHITIPLGQYVPLFEEVSRSPVQLLAPEVPPALGGGKAKGAGSKRAWLWIMGLVLVAALGTTFFFVRHTGRAPSATQNARLQSSDELVGLPAGDELHILAGSSRSYVDHAGKLWTADAYFTGGNEAKSQIQTQHIWRTQDPSFYRNWREGDFRYDLPLKRGIYELHLHFAETFYGPENIGGGGEGSRRINVSANGKPLLANFDVVADAGGSSTADVRVFTDIAPAADGLLHLEFSSSAGGGKAMVSAIEVLPGVRGRIRPVRILARQTSYYSNDSQWWSPDAYFKGGQLATDTAVPRGTDDPEFYESHRWGNFSYAIPVTPGKYRLTLYFSDDSVPHGNLRSEQDKSQADHVFSVYCNHNPILSNFDLGSTGSDVVVRHFVGLEADAQDKLLLEFVPVKGYATVTGIEILPQ